MSGFPMGSGGQGRLSLHVSCCSVSFFQLSMSHVLELVSETSTWLEEVGLCSIVVELCGNYAALSGSSQAVCRMPLMALGKMLREGFDPSAPAEIYKRKNAFLEDTEARSGFCLKQSLMSQGVFVHSSVMFTLFGPHTFICDQKHSSEEWCSVFFAHIYILVLKSTPQRRLPI